MGKAIYKNGEYVLDTPDLIGQTLEPIKNVDSKKTEPIDTIKVEAEKK